MPTDRQARIAELQGHISAPPPLTDRQKRIKELQGQVTGGLEAIVQSIPVEQVTEMFKLPTEVEDAPVETLKGIPGATGGFLTRGTFEAAGGIGGAALAGGGALPTGPGAVAAAAAGGALGTAGGGQAFDILDNAARMLRDEPPRVDKRTPAGQALHDATVDAAFTTGLGATGTIVRGIKPAIAKTFGVGTARTIEIAETAKKLGIDVGVLQASKGGLAKGFSSVVGVFPFIGKPLIEGQARTVGQIGNVAADLLNTLGPNLPKFDVSKALASGAMRRFAAFNRLSSSLYKKFNDVARNLSVPDIAPTTKARTAASDTLRDLSEEAVTVEGKEIGGKAVELSEFEAVLRDMDRLPEHITVQQARGFVRKFKDIADSTGSNFVRNRAAKMAGQFRQATKELDTSRLPEDEAKAVTDALSKADTFFKKNAGIFESATAKKFLRSDKSAFSSSKMMKPGTINSDEVFDVLRSRSPEALSDLKRIVGAGKFNNFVRKSIQKDIDASVIKAKEGSPLPDLFSAQKFKEKLGIGTKDGDAAFDAMLKDRPGFAKDFRKFLDLAETATDITIKNPSDFIVRRLILSGSLIGSIFAGAGSISIPAAVLLTMTTRKLSKALMNPRVLRDLNTAMEPVGASDRSKLVAITRLLRGVDSNKPNEERNRNE